jgi:hypothetical protein
MDRITKQAPSVPLPQWMDFEVAVPAAIGLLTVFFLIIFLLRSPRSSRAVPARKPRQPTPEYDPFLLGPVGEHRLAHRRTGNPVPVAVRTVGEERFLIGTVCDRSPGGLCLEMAEEIPSDVRLFVRPENAPPLMPWVEVEVRSVRPFGGTWQVGCRFLEPPTYAMLLMFG